MTRGPWHRKVYYHFFLGIFNRTSHVELTTLNSKISWCTLGNYEGFTYKGKLFISGTNAKKYRKRIKYLSVSFYAVLYISVSIISYTLYVCFWYAHRNYDTRAISGRQQQKEKPLDMPVYKLIRWLCMWSMIICDIHVT